MDRENIQPIKQVSAERSAPNLVLQIAIGRCNHPDIHVQCKGAGLLLPIDLLQLSLEVNGTFKDQNTPAENVVIFTPSLRFVTRRFSLSAGTSIQPRRRRAIRTHMELSLRPVLSFKLSRVRNGWVLLELHNFRKNTGPCTNPHLLPDIL